MKLHHMTFGAIAGTLAGTAVLPVLLLAGVASEIAAVIAFLFGALVAVRLARWASNGSRAVDGHVEAALAEPRDWTGENLFDLSEYGGIKNHGGFS